MKFPTLTEEIVTIQANQKQARQCYVASLKVAPYPPMWKTDTPVCDHVICLSKQAQANIKVLAPVKKYHIDVDPETIALTTAQSPMKGE